jgi:hypothetical protein
MWLVSREPRSIAGLGDHRPPAEAMEKPTGVPEPFHAPPSGDGLQKGAQRVDPLVLSELARPPAGSTHTEGEGSEPVERGGAAAEREGGVAGLPAPPARTLASPSYSSPQTMLNKSKLNDALAAALSAATPFIKQGFTTRDDYWGGVFDRSPKAVQHQLFRGNEYWFWLGSDRRKAGVDVHIYDSDGNLAEAEHWQREDVAGARLAPDRTGTYYMIISADVQGSDERAANPPIHWAMAYGYR